MDKTTIVKGKTKSGFEFEYDKERANDMRFLDVLEELDSNRLLLSKAARMILGAEQVERLYKHLETKDGRVPADLFEAEVTEIFNADNDVKNL